MHAHRSARTAIPHFVVKAISSQHAPDRGQHKVVNCGMATSTASGHRDDIEDHPRLPGTGRVTEFGEIFVLNRRRDGLRPEVREHMRDAMCELSSHRLGGTGHGFEHLHVGGDLARPARRGMTDIRASDRVVHVGLDPHREYTGVLPFERPVDVEALASKPHPAAFVVDETGHVKKGTKTVGVQRQYSGTAGRIENCQVAVYMTYTSSKGHALIDRALYLPRSWAEDHDRRTDAGVPEEVEFATKPALATEMITRTLDAGTPAAWVAGDEVYGSCPDLRTALQERQIGYVLAIGCNRKVDTVSGRCRVDELVAALPRRAWR